MPQARRKKKIETVTPTKTRKRAKKQPKLKKETKPKPAEIPVEEKPLKMEEKEAKPAGHSVMEKPQETKAPSQAAVSMETPSPTPQPVLPPPMPTPSPLIPVVEKKEMPQKTVLKITPENARFKYEVKKIPGAERLMLCFQCGTCTADCPVARFNEEYRPRRILRMTQLGVKDQVLKSDSIWLCAACYTCVDRCPQGVEISSVLRALRHLAVKEGYMPPLFKELGTAILQTGYAFKIPELRIKKRGDIGLPPLPKGNTEDIAKLFNATGFSKLLETSKRG
ncbi:MAG: 4Fe-4S dicluster domain-containing protein [Candidatus Bathyarchaeales archaeon]